MVLQIEEMYDEILTGKRKRFPDGTWSNDKTGKMYFARCFRFLMKRLNWNEEDIKDHLSNKFLYDHYLSSPITKLFGKNLYSAIKESYPNTEIKPWELKHSQVYWNDELIIQAIKWLIEDKLKFSKEDIIHHLTHQHFIENRLSGLISHHFDHKLYLAMQKAYPNENWDELSKRKAQTLKRKQTNIESGLKVSSRTKKLLPGDVRHIRSSKGKVDANELSEIYKVHPHTIRSIWNGKLHGDKL